MVCGWFVCGFKFDPSLHVAMVREKVHLGELFEQAFSQKIACGLKVFTSENVC